MSADLVLSNDGIQFANGSSMGRIPRSLLAGLTLSTAGSSATMSIAIGQASSSVNDYLIELTTSIAKTTSVWAVGTTVGGLDTGAITNSTWYHFYVIRRPDTGVVDVVFSTSASAPTLPANYTQYRRIGSGKTNGSAQWVLFKQTGDYFRWSVSVLDVNTTNPGIASVTATLGSVPTGVKVTALINGLGRGGTSMGAIYFRDLDAADEAPSTGAMSTPAGGIWISNGSAKTQGVQMEIMTNMSAQIAYRCDSSGASDVVGIATLGWTDTRGRNL